MKTSHPAYKTILAFLLLVLLGLGLYGHTFQAPFTFDDTPNILQNPHIRLTAITPEKILQIHKSPSPRPLANFTFAVNYFFHQYQPAGYRVINLGIHIITAWLIFLLVRSSLGIWRIQQPLIPLAAACLWLVHPLHTQSVTYIVQRMNSLATFFYVLALLCYSKARSMPAEKERSNIKKGLLFTVVILSGLLGLATKPIVAMLPIMLLLYEWFFFHNLDRVWFKKLMVWFFGAAVIFLLLAFLYLGESPIDKIMHGYAKRDFSLGERLLTQPRIVLFYISLLFFPHPARLNLDHDFPLSHALLTPATTALAILAIAVFFIGAITTARKNRLLSFAVLWFFGNLVLESSIIGLELFYEHRTYLPSIFPVIALTGFLLRNQPGSRRWTGIILMCAGICIASFWTYQRNTVWQDSRTLWKDCVEKSPHKARPYNNLGLTYKAYGNPQAALNAFQKSLTLDPQNDKALNNLGLIFQDQGKLSEALSCFQKALAVDPNHYNACYNMGMTLFDLGKWEDALQMYKKSLQIYPYQENAHNNIGIIHLKRGEAGPAIKRFQRALEINPCFAKACNNMGIIYFHQGATDKAVAYFQRALAINPAYNDARVNIKKVQNKAARYGPNIRLLIQAREQQPTNPALFYQLGQTYQTAGMINIAIEQYQKALRLKPDWTTCLNTLGNLYAALQRNRQAIETFTMLSNLLPHHAGVFYNLACLYAREGKKEAAVAHLKLAIQNGYNNWAQLKKDPDLANISKTEYYGFLMSRIREKQ